MSRFETIGRIVEQLHKLEDSALEDILADLADITDADLEAITRGSNDTEHLLSSSKNAADLDEVVKELSEYDLLTPQYAS